MIVAFGVPALSTLLLLLAARHAHAGGSLNGELGYGELEVRLVLVATLQVPALLVQCISQHLQF